MLDYRIYYVDARNHIRRAEDISCEGDEAAIAAVLALEAQQKVELWQLGRCVKVFDPKSESAER